MAIASEHDPKDGIAVINCQEKKPIVMCRFLPNVDTHLNSRWRVLIFRVQLMSLEYNRQVSSMMSFGSQGTRFPSKGENVTEST